MVVGYLAVVSPLLTARLPLVSAFLNRVALPRRGSVAGRRCVPRLELASFASPVHAAVFYQVEHTGGGEPKVQMCTGEVLAGILGQ